MTVQHAGLIQRMGIAIAVLSGPIAVWLAAAGCAAMATPARTSRDEPGGRAGTASFAVYALSRGRGVPEATLRAWQAIRTLLEDARREGALAQLQQTRLGLEGEVRLCAEFHDPQRGQQLLRRARDIGAGVELLNVVEEPCSRP